MPRCREVHPCCALGVPHEQVSALPLAVSDCALPPSSEAEEEDTVHALPKAACTHSLVFLAEAEGEGLV